jgi:hypothetical protein
MPIRKNLKSLAKAGVSRHRATPDPGTEFDSELYRVPFTLSGRPLPTSKTSRSRKSLWRRIPGGPDEGNLGQALHDAATGARQIDILSGYYGTDYLLGLLKSVRKRDRAACRVRLVFGVDSPSTLAMAADRLKTFQENLVKKGFKEPDILIPSIPVQTSTCH